MSALKLLKDASNAKPITNFDDLAAGDYLISSFLLVETKFGTRLRVDLGDKVVFMSARYAVGMTDEKVRELNDGQYLLCYKGKDKAQHNKLIVDFESLGDYVGPIYYK